VATGNSGLWIAGTNFVAEGDSVEEAVVKLDTELFTRSGSFETTFASGAVAAGAFHTEDITHNLNAYVVVQVIDDSINMHVEVDVEHLTANSIRIRTSKASTTHRVICVTNNRGP